jgi:arylsulfatase A-like enzyme
MSRGRGQATAATCIAAACLFTACHAPNPKTASRPNLILFLVDDLGWQDLSEPFGPTRSRQNDTFRTPNVERLCREGTRFTQAYAHCVCSPTRVSILTGAHPARHGVTNWTLHRDRAPDRPHPVIEPPTMNRSGLCTEPGTPHTYCAETLPQRLARAGYRSIQVGKAHFGAIGTPGSDPRRLGFDVNVAGHAAGAPSSYLASKAFLREAKDHVWQVPGLEPYHGSDAFLTDVLTTEALREIDRAIAADQPFYLHFAHYAVHTPLNRDERFVTRYEAMGLDRKEAMYAAMVEGVDHSLGRLLDHLERRGILADTMIVFASDNGGLSAHGRGGEAHRHNAPLRSGKGSAYEGGTRVPLAVRWPKQARPGRTCEIPVCCEDLFATLCDAAGAETSCPDGQSLLPLLRGDEAPSHLADRDLFWHYPHVWGAIGPGIAPHSSVRSGDHKLVWFWAAGTCELYDLAQDLGETHDLSQTLPETTSDLRARLRRFLQETGAMLPSRKDGKPLAMP